MVQTLKIEQPADSARVAHLLTVARHQFSTHGFQHVSIDGIAREAGVSKETIYRHFADKGALFEAALTDLRDAFAAEVAGMAALDPVSDASVEGYLRALYPLSANDHLSGVWLAITNINTFPELSARLAAAGMRWLDPIRDALSARAVAEGHAGAVALEHAGDLSAMTIEGARHLMSFPWLEGEDRDLHIAATTHLFLYGCGGGASRQPPRLPAPDTDEPPVADSKAASRADHIATLITVARDHFEAHGYRGASLDVIGAEARVGRGTLYRHFGGKAGLFEAVIMDEAQALSVLSRTAVPALDRDATPDEALLSFARAIYRIINSPRSLALHRLVIAEARRAPDLARRVYTTTRLGLLLPLADYFAEGGARGRFQIADADWYARQFLTIAAEGLRPLTRTTPVSPADRERTARRAVATFLRGFAAALDRPD